MGIIAVMDLSSLRRVHQAKSATGCQELPQFSFLGNQVTPRLSWLSCGSKIARHGNTNAVSASPLPRMPRADDGGRSGRAERRIRGRVHCLWHAALRHTQGGKYDFQWQHRERRRGRKLSASSSRTHCVKHSFPYDVAGFAKYAAKNAGAVQFAGSAARLFNSHSLRLI